MKKAVAPIAVIAALVMVGSGIWPFQDSSQTYSGTPESITVGIPPSEGNALIYIAENQGFFAGNGISVTMREYDTGVAAVNGLLNNDVDMALTTDYVTVRNAFQKKNISIVGNIDKGENDYLIGRKDHGIEDIPGLKGKRIGVARQTIMEFYLGRFLELHGMSIHDVTLVDLKPSQYVDAITNGSVDAIMIMSNYIDPVNKRLGANQVMWQAQSSQPSFWALSCRNDWVASHPQSIARFLKSLGLAEDYIVNHPTEAKAIVQKRLNYTDAYIAAIWPKNQFSLTLDQSLITAMEDKARWMIKNNLTTEKNIPDFRNYIYRKGLEEVKPESVNIR